MDYTIGVSQSIRQIFAGALVGAVEESNPKYLDIIKDGAINYARLKANFPTNIFQDEYAVFYDVLVTENIKVFSVAQLQAIIDNNRDLILDSPFVDLSKYNRLENGNTTDDDEKIEAFKATMSTMMVELSNTYVDTDTFNSSCKIFIDYFKNHFMLDTGHNITRIMNTGYEEKRPGKRKVKYAGFDDANRYFNERRKILDELSEDNRVRSTVLDQDWYIEEQEKENTPDENALMTLGIKKIDDVMGELRRSNMIGILGPPKGGKTRFSNFIVQRALSLGLNVCVWPLEGTKEEWIAMQQAAYIARKYGQHIDSKAILQRKFESEQERSLVRAAKFEMVSSKDYGRLSFIEGAAYSEDFISVLEAHYDNDNPFDVIVIDSLVNILSKTGKTKTDRISSAYMELKAFVSNILRKPALAIVPAQLKQDVVDYLRSHPNETIDVTAGGESSETIRSPDTVLGLFSTKEERASGYMKIYSVASRHSAAFEDFQIRTDLKCCHFYDE